MGLLLLLFRCMVLLWLRPVQNNEKRKYFWRFATPFNPEYLNLLGLLICTYRLLYPLELFLGRSQGHKLVRALHLDGGRVRRGPIGNPLQQETQSRILTTRTLLGKNNKNNFGKKCHFVMTPECNLGLKYFFFKFNFVCAMQLRQRQFSSKSLVYYFHACLLMQWMKKTKKKIPKNWKIEWRKRYRIITHHCTPKNRIENKNRRFFRFAEKMSCKQESGFLKWFLLFEKNWTQNKTNWVKCLELSGKTKYLSFQKGGEGTHLKLNTKIIWIIKNWHFSIIELKNIFLNEFLFFWEANFGDFFTVQIFLIKL